MNLENLVDLDFHFDLQDYSESDKSMRHLNPKLLFHCIYGNKIIPKAAERIQYLIKDLSHRKN